MHVRSLKGLIDSYARYLRCHVLLLESYLAVCNAPAVAQVKGDSLLKRGTREDISGARKPLLRWAGSKRQILGPLKALIPDSYSTYVEPFCGSAALFYALSPKRATLADANPDLINFYQNCQSNAARLFASAIAIPREKDCYLGVREQLKSEKSSYKRAVYFYYLNKNCFNGLYRTNKAGEFNVPFAPLRTGAMPSKEEFLLSASSLRHIDTITCDFQYAIESTIEKDALYFIDPPYAIARRKPFAEYLGDSFSQEDIPRLRECLHLIHRKGANFILTYDAQAGELFSQGTPWKQYDLQVRRNISGFAGARKIASEIVVTNIG